METAIHSATPAAAVSQIDLSKESIGRLAAGGVLPAEPKPVEQAPRNVLRVTNAVAQYNVSKENPDALANIGKALAGSLDRDDFTYFDPESRKEIRIGDVLVAVDLHKKDQVVLCHRDSAGKGILGRLACSLNYMSANPVNTLAMKALGLVADPEVIYEQKVIQILAQLDREGLFGPSGASTFNLADWEIDTRSAWRDVVIRKAPAVAAPAPQPDVLDTFLGALKVPAA